MVRPDVHPRLTHVLERSWNADPEARPTAAQIVYALEDIQEEVLGTVAHELSKCVTYASVPAKIKVRHDQDYFCGEDLVDCMLNMDMVSSAHEAIRLGNALMDTGLIHHAKHSRPFENTMSLFFFDNGFIDHTTTAACLVTSSARTLHEIKSDTTASEYRIGADVGVCACKKLAQGFHVRPSKGRHYRRSTIMEPHTTHDCQNDHHEKRPANGKTKLSVAAKVKQHMHLNPALSRHLRLDDHEHSLQSKLLDHDNLHDRDSNILSRSDMITTFAA
jgi:hypothetical protein